MSGRFLGEPPDPPAAEGRPGYLVWGPILILAAAALTVAAVLAVEALRRPPQRTLPEPDHGSVLIVPIGDVPAEMLAAVPSDYHAEYGLTVELAPAMPMPAAGYDVARQQWVAQDLIAAMWAAHPELQADHRVAIAITASDMYIRDVDWNWAFALRQGGRLAVISTWRMKNAGIPGGGEPGRLMRKMITREIGFLCYGLPPSNDPNDVLYRSILGVDDLVRIGDHL